MNSGRPNTIFLPPDYIYDHSALKKSSAHVDHLWEEVRSYFVRLPTGEVKKGIHHRGNSFEVYVFTERALRVAMDHQ
jgi:hypothetical protein